jgi:hypothetical protein
MSVSIYLISLTDEDDDNEMFVLKYIHLITNKSFEIRNEVIKSIELIIRNNPIFPNNFVSIIQIITVSISLTTTAFIKFNQFC